MPGYRDDLSSEPLILVCAAGVERGNAQDVEKEVEIFAAHKACPVVIASEGGGTWRAAKATLLVPNAGRELTFVLATMGGICSAITPPCRSTRWRDRSVRLEPPSRRPRRVPTTYASGYAGSWTRASSATAGT